jgi:hypothetical protein
MAMAARRTHHVWTTTKVRDTIPHFKKVELWTIGPTVWESCHFPYATTHKDASLRGVSGNGPGQHRLPWSGS